MKAGQQHFTPPVAAEEKSIHSHLQQSLLKRPFPQTQPCAVQQQIRIYKLGTAWQPVCMQHTLTHTLTHTQATARKWHKGCGT
jgi:hypothetical protein